MAIDYRVLGQSNPVANTLTDIYTVSSFKETVISTIAICNQANIASRFSIAIRPAGANIESKHYITFRTALPALDTITLTWGITMGNTDVVTANVESSNVSISVFGSEIS
jgi:hypothetical protein